ncbi:hypothetical protein KKB83_01850 [Patescibacteria group bacterium]|nr:hypothetical protein [Patescibacteria group bacterium]
MNKNKLYTFLILALLFLSFNSQSSRAADKVTLYFFWSNNCSHCKDEMVFLKSIQEKYERVEIKEFEVTSNRENAKLFQEVCQLLGNPSGRVPYLVVGDQPVIGYINDETTGIVIEGLVTYALEYQCVDAVGFLTDPQPTSTDEPCPTPFNNSNSQVTTINIPFIGELDLKNLSLPALTVILGFLDGFNPCAMWALLFLISLLLNIKDSLRRWVLGMAFIVTSAIVYFLFMTAWLQLFIFFGLVTWIRITIGLAALGIAVYNLRDYWVNRSAVCKVGDINRKQKIFGRLREIAENRTFATALVGIIALAFAVNLIELICSAGLPAIYTNILSFTEMSTWKYYFYLLIYVFFFMLDDLAVFTVAMATMKAVGLESKYARYSRLVGGILILIIGLLLLLKPEVLMFG